MVDLFAVTLQAGNAAYQVQKHQQAADEYSRAIDIRVEDPVFNAVLYCNRAAAYIGLSKYVDAIADCFSAAHLDPFYIRVLQRRADAYTAIGDHSNAAQVCWNVVASIRTILRHCLPAHLYSLIKGPQTL